MPGEPWTNGRSGMLRLRCRGSWRGPVESGSDLPEEKAVGLHFEDLSDGFWSDDGLWSAHGWIAAGWGPIVNYDLAHII